MNYKCKEKFRNFALLMDIQALKNKYDIIGNDPALNEALETAIKFAPTDLSVLIQGESGVGKESFARITSILHARTPACSL